MRSTRSSSAVVAVLLALALATPVAAVSTSADVPDRAAVGEEVEATFTVTDLYSDGTNEWTLRGATELEGVSWTVTKETLSGDVVSESYGGSSFETSVRSSENVETVTVTVTGDAPAVERFSYDPPQRFTVGRLVRIRGENENELDRWRVHHHTEESAAARDALDAAREAMGDDPPDAAQRDFDQAVSAYEAGNFENAISNAEDAEDLARQARQSSARTQLLMYAGVGVLALALVFGGVFYWRSRRDTYDRLR